jgi:hypothetical protein
MLRRQRQFGRHCEERGDEAIRLAILTLDCFAALAMTEWPLPCGANTAAPYSFQAT